MSLEYVDENVIVNKPPRRINPDRLAIANEIFDELTSAGFVEEADPNCPHGSPIVLVTYDDDRKPRLTGDYSGSDGVNAMSIPVEANLPKIFDILEFLSSAEFIVTLDLPRAFWQLRIEEKDFDKTTLKIPGRAIRFTRAAFGLKNVPAVSQSWLPLGYMGDLVLGPDKGSLPRDRPSGQVKCHESLTAEFWLKSCVSMVDSIVASKPLERSLPRYQGLLRSKSCENSKPIDWLRNSSQYLFLQPFLPQSTNPDYLSAVAAQDRAEHLVEEVLNIDTTRQRCLVRWVGASEPTGNLSLRFATPPLTLSS
ncbi:hypothetical protein GEMRC1_001037 [Eukaryota sp. GEM-RC1]